MSTYTFYIFYVHRISYLVTYVRSISLLTESPEGDSGKLSNIRYSNFTFRKVTFTDKEIRDYECFVTLLHRQLVN